MISFLLFSLLFGLICINGLDSNNINNNSSNNIIYITDNNVKGNRYIFNFMQLCGLCQKDNIIQFNGLVSDCNCDFNSVNYAVKSYFSLILEKLTSTTYFRYFRVDLDSSCPFWNEFGQCNMEGCSVCECDEREIPKTWLDDYVKPNIDLWEDYNNNIDSSTTGAWISDGKDQSDQFSSLVPNSAPYGYLQYLEETEDDDNDMLDWTDMAEDNCGYRKKSKGRYVNLLQNPEAFTGYSGPSAHRVWQSIQQENCFGGLDDICLEKRVFYRLMSGLQSSISTHIAKQYYYPDGKWDYNVPFFFKAVGSHPDRLNNLYFTFLFVLRSVVKAGDFLKSYPYQSGNATDDKLVHDLISRLVSTRLHDENNNIGLSGESSSEGFREALVGLGSVNDDDLQECRNGFDESILFQVPSGLSGPSYWRNLEEKQILREEFRQKFRNITRIMDCVACEKCRVWGKLQILGLGTSIKILLTPEEEISSGKIALNRQEIISLLNTLHQLAKSVEFASFAGDFEIQTKLNDMNKKLATTVTGMAVILLLYLFLKRK